MWHEILVRFNGTASYEGPLDNEDWVDSERNRDRGGWRTRRSEPRLVVLEWTLSGPLPAFTRYIVYVYEP